MVVGGRGSVPGALRACLAGRGGFGGPGVDLLGGVLRAWSAGRWWSGGGGRCRAGVSPRLGACGHVAVVPGGRASSCGDTPARPRPPRPRTPAPGTAPPGRSPAGRRASGPGCVPARPVGEPVARLACSPADRRATGPRTRSRPVGWRGGGTVPRSPGRSVRRWALVVWASAGQLGGGCGLGGVGPWGGDTEEGPRRTSARPRPPGRDTPARAEPRRPSSGSPPHTPPPPPSNPAVTREATPQGNRAPPSQQPPPPAQPPRNGPAPQARPSPAKPPRRGSRPSGPAGRSATPRQRELALRLTEC